MRRVTNGNAKLFGKEPTSQRTVQKVFKHHYRGRSQYSISKALGISQGSTATWMADRDWYYPWIDEVVIARALHGDPEAWRVATIYERFELRKRLAARLQREPWDTTAHRPTNTAAVEHWTEVVAAGAGVTGEQLRRALVDSARRKLRTAA